MNGKPDWNTRYARGDTPWDCGVASHELCRVVTEQPIRPCRTLEMGCGTGNDAVHLARLGFAVTAFDVAPLAIQRAQAKAAAAGVTVRWLTADLRRMPDLGPPFDFVFDSGFYHCVRRELLGELLTLLERATRPGSLWLTLAGNANDPQPQDRGPPRLRAAELCGELEPLFAVVQLRETYFDAAKTEGKLRPLAWSALLRRR